MFSDRRRDGVGRSRNRHIAVSRVDYDITELGRQFVRDLLSYLRSRGSRLSGKVPAK